MPGEARGEQRACCWLQASLGRCLLWLLVAWELLAHAASSAAILAVSPLLPNVTVSGRALSVSYFSQLSQQLA
jgi:hypothetical protein